MGLQLFRTPAEQTPQSSSTELALQNSNSRNSSRSSSSSDIDTDDGMPDLVSDIDSDHETPPLIHLSGLDQTIPRANSPRVAPPAVGSGYHLNPRTSIILGSGSSQRGVQQRQILEARLQAWMAEQIHMSNHSSEPRPRDETNRSRVALYGGPPPDQPFLSGLSEHSGGERRYRPIPNTTEIIRRIRDDPPFDDRRPEPSVIFVPPTVGGRGSRPFSRLLPIVGGAGIEIIEGRRPSRSSSTNASPNGNPSPARGRMSEAYPASSLTPGPRPRNIERPALWSRGAGPPTYVPTRLSHDAASPMTEARVTTPTLLPSAPLVWRPRVVNADWQPAISMRENLASTAEQQARSPFTRRYCELSSQYASALCGWCVRIVQQVQEVQDNTTRPNGPGDAILDLYNLLPSLSTLLGDENEDPLHIVDQVTILLRGLKHYCGNAQDDHRQIPGLMEFCHLLVKESGDRVRLREIWCKCIIVHTGYTAELIVEGA